jgi:hypothetical protein
MADEPTAPGLTRLAAGAAIVVGALSLVYAVFYLFVAPSAQRGADAGAYFTSYVSDPTGLRVASACLFVSGLLTTLVYAALHGVPGRLPRDWRTWALAVGSVAGIATSAHGLGDLYAVDKLAHTYATGDAATKAAVVVAHSLPAQVDPRGLATFGVVGLVVFAFSWHLRDRNRILGVLGMVLGVDMVLLFAASAFASTVPILVTGGLASVVLGPAWWVGVGVDLWRGPVRATAG